MATTVGKLAAEVGVSIEQVIDACARARVSVFGEQTPLDAAEATRVRALLGVGPMLPPPGAGPALGYPAQPPEAPAPPPQGPWAPGPWGPMPQPPAPKPSGGGLPVPLAIVVGLLVAAIAGVGFTILGGGSDDEPSSASASASTVTTFAGVDLLDEEEELSFFGPVLRVGDCWDDLTESTGAVEVDAEYNVVPCSGPHDSEVYAVIDHEAGQGAPFPGEALGDHAVDQCNIRFEGFVGRPLAESVLDTIAIYPQERGWLLGDREIVCSIYPLDGVPLTGTAAGSGR